MNDDNVKKIGGYSVIALMVTFIGASAVLFIPYGTTAIAKQDAWMAPLLVFPSSVYVIWVVCWLGSLFPDKGFIEYLPLIVGKWLGKLLGLSYVLFFTYFSASVVREALAFLYGVGIFRVTPGLAISLLLMLATTYAIASGIESMSRSIWYLWLITVVFFALAVFMALPMVKISGLMPIGESGTKAILKSSLLPNAFRGEIFWLVILFPYIRSKREALMGGLVATILLSIFISLTVVLCITIMGVETTAQTYFSVFSLGDYLESTGIKAVLATIWIIFFWGKITLGQFSLTIGLSQLCGFKDHRALILPVAMMLLIFSQAFYPNTTDLISSVKNTFTGMGLTFEYILPTALLIVAIIKQKLGMLNNPAASDQVEQANQSVNTV